VDGPVLEKEFSSFVGMQPIPVVYGMTEGEYAKMLLGEKWLDWKYVQKEDKQSTSLGLILGFEEKHTNFKLTVIPCKHYTHISKYVLPINPSPNLPDMASIYWYTSICFFEGTNISEGRGTDHPFCIFGHPSFPDTLIPLCLYQKLVLNLLSTRIKSVMAGMFTPQTMPYCAS
jgi:uncharacterized protein YbbC (DUF1343 family)